MSETVSGEELEKINGYAREPLTEDKVFVFRVALCDNDIDRDGEKFSSGALEKLCLRKLQQTERSTAGLWQRLTWCELLLTATL